MIQRNVAKSSSPPLQADHTLSFHVQMSHFQSRPGNVSAQTQMLKCQLLNPVNIRGGQMYL